MRHRTTTLKNGTKVTRTIPGDKEWQMQAEAVRALRALPEFGRLFALAGDMNAARRGPAMAAIAKATGMAAGEPDLRVYMAGGRLGLIELKTATGRLSPAQRDRHAVLGRLGFTRIVVVKATTRHDAAAQVVSVVRGWLVEQQEAANDNQPSTVAPYEVEGDSM